MPGHIPLRAVRDILKNGLPQAGPSAMSADAVAIAMALPPHVGVTIDYDAVTDLGYPLVIVSTQHSALPPWFNALSQREQQVARCIARGDSNKEIARTLGIAPSTIKDHVHKILVKSGLAGRTQITASLHPSMANKP